MKINLEIRHQFIRFLFVGLLNTAVGLILYSLLILLNLHYAVAIFFSTCGGVLFNFFSTRRWVFQNMNAKLFTFCLAYSFIYLLNVGLVKFHLRLGLNEYAAYFFSIPIIAIVSFALMRMFVFNSRS